MSVQPTQAWVPEIDFGARLLLARRYLKLTVKEASAKCGLKYSTWSTWESGGRTPANMAEVVKQIHEGLGVRREWLMWGTGDGPDDGGDERARRDSNPKPSDPKSDTRVVELPMQLPLEEEEVAA